MAPFPPSSSTTTRWQPASPTSRRLASALLLLSAYLPPSLSSSSSSCPAHCACSHQLADCAGRGFSGPPIAGPYGMTSLLMEDNHLGQIEVGPLAASWPRLKSLDLSRNRIRDAA